MAGFAAALVQRMATTPDLGQSALNAMPAATVGPSIFGFNTIPTAPVQTTGPDRRLYSYVCTKVEELPPRNYPPGSEYKLGTICGVESRICSAYHKGMTCYHVNFLVSISDDISDSATTSSPECKLHFAEFWNRTDDQLERPKKPPVCCQIQDYNAFPGRCFICEGGLVKIVHPPCGNYFMGREISTDALCAAEERHADLGQ